MPAFAEPGLLFVHIPKNAGRSVEQALLQGRGSLDSGGRSVLNRAARWLLRQSASRFAEDHLIGTIDRSFAAQHLTFGEMQMLSLNIDGLDPFAICRNPFDRAVSSVFHFRDGGSSAPSDPGEFEAMLERWLDRPLADHNDRAHRRPQSDYLLDQRGNLAVERVLRFENLAEEFAVFTRQRGLSGVSLAWHGKSQREGSYRDYFTPHARKRIESEFASDLERFGYSF